MRSAIESDLRAIFEGGTVAGLTDGQLLARFAAPRAKEAEPAFTALVARHGPMVLGVCQGLLGTHDAEDAFQATFLVLARKAGALRQPDLLGPWLHGVAHRTARRLRDKNARRRRHEAEAAMCGATPLGHAERHESRPVSRDEIEALHEEIERLPERYRTAVVLCHLQGLTHDEAARRLGRPVGTISARLSRARERLRSRLSRRGLALPAGMMATAMGTKNASAVPAALASSTARIAMSVSAGLTAGSIPASIATLSQGVLRSMVFAKLRMISAMLFVLGAAAGSMVVLAQHGGPRKLTPGVENAGGRPQPAAKPSTTDSLGDPLPSGARLRLGTLRFRPPSMVVDLALSPDETTIVTVGDELIVWDAPSGKERWRVPGRDYGFDNPPAAAYGQRAVTFSADSGRFYTPGRVGRSEIVVWETASGRHEVLRVAAPNPRGDFEGMTRSVDITSDGRMLAVGNGRGLVVCDLHGKVLFEIANAHGPFHIDQNDRLLFFGDYSLGRFSPDATILAVVTSDRPEEIRLYETETGRELRRVALASRLVRLAFSPDGKQLATTERDKAVRLYDVTTGNRAWSHIVKLTDIRENYTSAIAFSPDGKNLAVCATDYRIYLMNPSTGEETAQLTGHHWYPWTLAFTADSKMLYSSGWDPAIRRWDVAARKQLALPTGVRATVVVAASPDGRTLAYGDDSGAVRLVEAVHGTERRTLALPGTEYSQLLFSPDGSQLAGGGTSGDRVHVAVWEVPSGKVLHRWDWPKGRDPHSDVESLSFTPDGSRLAASVFRQSAAYVWDLTIDQQIAQLAHNQVYGLSFSPDGRTLATAGWDEIIRFWETETGDLRREIKVADRIRDHDRKGAAPAIPQPAGARDDLRMYAVCFAPEGDLIATAHIGGAVRIWQADEMLLRTQFAVPGLFSYGTMSFSPDGLWLATGASDGGLEVWDPSTARSVWKGSRHENYVYKVGFGLDARSLVTGGEDGVCYLWDLRPPGVRPDKDPARLWQDLAGEDGPAAYQAMWALCEMPDRAVALLAEKLRPVKTVIDLDRVDRGNSDEEIRRLRRMKTLLIHKDPKVASAVAVRRGVALLAQLGTPDAIGLLIELARQEPNRDVGRFAAAALDRLRRSGKP
jgi:RNA polymerase sigma factor (sigma-70 family)